MQNQSFDKECKVQAVKQENPPEGVVPHSDRGSQYASNDDQDRLIQYGMTCSMSRKRNCYDNACVESFHSVLKKELVYQETFSTREQAKQQLFE